MLWWTESISVKHSTWAHLLSSHNSTIDQTYRVFIVSNSETHGVAMRARELWKFVAIILPAYGIPVYDLNCYEHVLVSYYKIVIFQRNKLNKL